RLCTCRVRGRSRLWLPTRPSKSGCSKICSTPAHPGRNPASEEDKSPAFAGLFEEPSDELEPSTPYGENAGGVGLRVGPRASGRGGGPRGRVVVWGVRGSGGGLEGDVVAERFELFDEPAGSVFG